MGEVILNVILKHICKYRARARDFIYNFDKYMLVLDVAHIRRIQITTVELSQCST